MAHLKYELKIFKYLNIHYVNSIRNLDPPTINKLNVSFNSMCITTSKSLNGQITIALSLLYLHFGRDNRHFGHVTFYRGVMHSFCAGRTFLCGIEHLITK